MLSFAIFGAQNAVFMLPPILVEIASDLEISVAVAGQLATTTFAAWAVSLIMAGPLSDSFGRRPVILAGLLVLVASVIASAFAPNIEVFLALRVLSGLVAGMLPPTSVGVLSDVISPERRAQAVSSLLAIGILTSAVSVPLSLGLADLGGWRFAFIVAGLLLAAGFLSNWLWFPRDNKERVRNWAFFLQVLVAGVSAIFPDSRGGWPVPTHSVLDDGQLFRSLPEGYLRVERGIRGSAAGDSRGGTGDGQLYRRPGGDKSVPRLAPWRYFSRRRGLRLPVLYRGIGTLDGSGGGNSRRLVCWQ